jgi:Tannase and feruloyl esterase
MKHSSRLAAFTALAPLAAIICAPRAMAHPGNANPAPTEAAASCQALVAGDFSRVEDAPLQVVDAHIVPPSGRRPAYCEVRGYVYPQVGILMRLPLEHWNGKLVEIGDGGWGGEMYLFLCEGPVRRGYACIASDMGHQGASRLGLWAEDNLQAQADWGFRATHVTALAGHALLEAYYSKAAARSYFYGCSTGGYQGLVESQRFPWDFDGIVAIAPDAESEADISMRIVWKFRNLLDADGRPVLSHSDLVLLHEAALKACDLSDGVKDGVIGDPIGCRFDPGVLICRSGQTTGCLSARQIEAVRNVYAGPHTSAGVPISTRGLFPGTELDWEVDASSAAEVADFFKYILYRPAPGAAWKITDFDFDRDYKRLGLGAMFTDNNPDLRRFKAAGGKLLVAQGGGDPLEVPGAIFDYYDTVERTMGGRAATMDFFRLFLVPGMKHCSAGDGAFAVDYLTYLENWVEHGKAPDMMIGAHVDSRYLIDHSDTSGSDADKTWWGAFKLTFPLDPEVPVTFTRALYPYPLHAKYKGTGNPNDARSFVAAGPDARSRGGNY